VHYCCISVIYKYIYENLKRGFLLDVHRYIKLKSQDTYVYTKEEAADIAHKQADKLYPEVVKLV